MYFFAKIPQNRNIW